MSRLLRAIFHGPRDMEATINGRSVGECPDMDCDGFFHRALRDCCGWSGVVSGCSSICICPGCHDTRHRSHSHEAVA